MTSEKITIYLTVLLIFSCVILGILLLLFLILTFKNKKEKDKDKENIDKINKNIKTNEIQTRAYTTKNVKSFMDFDEIKDNMILQNNGKRYIMVIQCQGINYDLMSSIEKVSVEKGFVQFLNSLTRPLQLYIQTRKVNLEDSLRRYKARLKDIETRYRKIDMQYKMADKQQNLSVEQYNKLRYEYTKQKNLYEYTKDIIHNTETLNLNPKILTKKYYMAISYIPDNTDGLYQKDEISDMAFSELYTNAQALLRVLSTTGVTGKVLNSTELADLLYSAYNRDASEVFGVDKAISAEYDALYTTAPDVFDKKIKELDKIIKEKALKLANTTIEEVTLEGRRKKELEEKENNIQELIKEMAKSMIYENEAYISSEISREAIEKIDEQSNKEQKA